MTTDRDRSIDALLRQRRADDADPQSVESCVDAEVLAAWVEGALSGDALAAAEKHAAGCARCQALLASMARTAPDTAARPWWHSLTAKWLVPVAAVATALVVWVSVGRTPRSVTTPSPALVTASRETAPAEPPAARPAAPAPASADQASRQTAESMSAVPEQLRKDAAARPGDTHRAQETVAEPKAPPLPVAGLAGGTLDAIRPRVRAGADNAAAADAARPAASPAPPPPAAQLRAEGVPAAAAPGAPLPQLKAPATPAAVAETVTVTGERPVVGFAAGRGGGGGTSLRAAVEIRSPEAEYRWMIVPPASVQRSTDGGVTWAKVDPIPAPSGDAGLSAMVLTAGSAPARNVCWIVGRGGVVLLSTDGATWLRRPLPEAADLNAVRAVDAKTSTVTTVDGRQFSTTDGGATWVQGRERPDVGRD